LNSDGAVDVFFVGKTNFLEPQEIEKKKGSNV
jgi:hypothetical protein